MIPITWSAVWLGIIIIAVIVEIITVGLWAVWFACGAACAFLALHFGATVNMQIAVFLIVSFGLEYLLRPNFVKFVCRRKSSRHAGELIGQKVRVIAPIDNANGEGRVVVGNMEWRAKAKRDEYVFAPGDTAVIDRVEDIVLIVEPDVPVDNAMAQA